MFNRKRRIQDSSKGPTMFDHLVKPDIAAPGNRIKGLLVQGSTLAKAHPDITVHVYAADHGFNCDQRGSYNAEAAKLARERTLAFFRQHLG